MSNVIRTIQATQRRALGARRVPIPRACSIAMRSVIARIKTRAGTLTQHPSTMSWRFRQVVRVIGSVARTHESALRNHVTIVSSQSPAAARKMLPLFGAPTC